MLTQTIPSYAYQEYSDDYDIKAFVRAYNTLTQRYIDWFIGIGLPIYTGDQINSKMLDWVGEGIYGLPRPVLSNWLAQGVGALGTWRMGTYVLGTLSSAIPPNASPTSDDIYKRILTWRLYRGDGFVFSVEWLKKRIMRFLNGMNGIDPGIDNTYPVSVKFQPNNLILIGYNLSNITVTRGAIGSWALGTIALGGFDFTIQTYPGNMYWQYFVSALNVGILDLPFQYKFQIIQ